MEFLVPNVKHSVIIVGFLGVVIFTMNNGADIADKDGNGRLSAIY